MVLHHPTANGRAGLRHVGAVRPNRAADFRGLPFWTLKRTRNAAIRCVLRAYTEEKCDCGRRSADIQTDRQKDASDFIIVAVAVGQIIHVAQN